MFLFLVVTMELVCFYGEEALTNQRWDIKDVDARSPWELW